MKINLFTLKVPTEYLNYMLIGSQKFIESLMVYLPVMVFYLIMNQKEEEKHLLQEKLQKDYQKL